MSGDDPARRMTSLAPTDTIDLAPDLLLAARSLLLEWEAGIAIDRLRSAGVESILLKGPVIARWLYDEGEVRPFCDVDLLVSPSRFSAAMEILAENGYSHRLAGAAAAEMGPKERELYGPGDVCIDLHAGLLGVTADPQRSWDLLVGRTMAFRLRGGMDVQVLDVPARAMHLALHAAQNGPVDEKAVSDLRRGLKRIERVDWVEAAKLAVHLNALEALSAGLRIVPEGANLVAELSLPTRMTVELLLRTQSAGPDAIFFARFGEAPGVLGKAALVARKVFPTTVLLRANSAVARRGVLGLVCARLYRPLSLAIRFGPAFRAWNRARRTVAGQQ